MKDAIARFFNAAFQPFHPGIVVLLLGLPVSSWACPIFWNYNVFYQGSVPAVCAEPDACIAACEASDGVACAHLGKFFLGSKIGGNFRSAARYFHQACILGQDSSCRMAGLIVKDVGRSDDLPAAAEIWLAGCRRGGAESCGAWLRRFANPDEVATEYQADVLNAIRQVGQACFSGEIESCRMQRGSGSVALSGEEAPDARALRLARTGCRLNDPAACIGLWAIRSIDLTDPALTEQYKARQTAQAIYLQRCLESSDYYACHNAGNLYPADDSPEAKAAAAQRAAIESEWNHGFRRKLCAGGDDDSCLEFAWSATGFVTDPDYRNPTALDHARARELLEIACGRGNAVACHNLGLRLHTGWGGVTDTTRALLLYDKACASQGCAELAFLSGSGRFGPADPEKAMDFVRRACAAGDSCVCDEIEQAESVNKGSLDWTAANRCSTNHWMEEHGRAPDSRGNQ